ncbi:hypothetical protein AAE478_010201 [Parahypoxylon ruwenzoriense]
MVDCITSSSFNNAVRIAPRELTDEISDFTIHDVPNAEAPQQHQNDQLSKSDIIALVVTVSFSIVSCLLLVYLMYRRRSRNSKRNQARQDTSPSASRRKSDQTGPITWERELSRWKNQPKGLERDLERGISSDLELSPRSKTSKPYLSNEPSRGQVNDSNHQDLEDDSDLFTIGSLDDETQISDTVDYSMAKAVPIVCVRATPKHVDVATTGSTI